jgi:2-polyprenyl-3-methyl-5-hydroxy-6-metoxy-1,4-benzoquinol methylase
MNVLEIGCGNGAFLKLINNKVTAVKGLELNERAVEYAISNGLNVTNETIEDHSLNAENFYDVVICFQVLEHVTNVNSFIEASVRALKKGGKLIFAIPNNDNCFFEYIDLKWQFPQYQQALLLNMPPHHFNRWTTDSLKYLGEIFPLELNKFIYEPLSDSRAYLNKTILKRKYPFLNYLPEKLNEKIQSSFKSLNRGDTVIVVYTKR